MNIGRLDQIIRLIIGAVLFGLAFFGIVSEWFYVISAIPLTTAVIRWCPLYSLLGVQTCPLHEQVYKK